VSQVANADQEQLVWAKEWKGRQADLLDVVAVEVVPALAAVDAGTLGVLVPKPEPARGPHPPALARRHHPAQPRRPQPPQPPPRARLQRRPQPLHRSPWRRPPRRRRPGAQLDSARDGRHLLCFLEPRRSCTSGARG
jgi:hypothetical protein